VTLTEEQVREITELQRPTVQAQTLLNHATGQTTRRYQLGPKIVSIS